MQKNNAHQRKTPRWAYCNYQLFSFIGLACELLDSLVSTGCGKSAGCTEHDGYKNVLSFHHSRDTEVCNSADDCTKGAGDKRDKPLELFGATNEA